MSKPERPRETCVRCKHHCEDEHGEHSCWRAKTTATRYSGVTGKLLFPVFICNEARRSLALCNDGGWFEPKWWYS